MTCFKIICSFSVACIFSLFYGCSEKTEGNVTEPDQDSGKESTYMISSDNVNMPTGGRLSTNCTETLAGNTVDKVVDDNPFTYFSTSRKDFSFVWKGDEKVQVENYWLLASPESKDSAPSSWKLYGSDDNASWKELDSRSGFSFEGTDGMVKFEFDNEHSYRYYKLDVSDNGGADITSIAEWSLSQKVVSSVAVNESASLPSQGKVTAENDDSPLRYSIAGLVDGDPDTKFLTRSSELDIFFELEDSHYITGYSMTSADDCPEKDPATWTFYGSNDNQSWMELDSQSDVVFSGRKETKSFMMASTDEFKFYRLEIKGNSGGTSTQIAEFSIHDSRLCGFSYDGSKEFQVMENFGASDCWTCRFVGKNWPLSVREQIADLLFSKEMDKDGNPEGIGLSMWRFNIGAGSAENPENKITNQWRTTECFSDSEGNYDFTGKQQGQVWFLKAARERGCEYILGFCNSAPWFMTKNGQACNIGGSATSYNMEPDKYPDFASFLSHVWHGLKDTHGLELDYISPFNEPEWDWKGTDQEGSPASVSEMSAFIRCLGKEFQTSGVNASIVFPETGDYRYMYIGTGSMNKTYNFFNPESSNYIGDVPGVEKLMLGHSYWTSHESALVSTRKSIYDEMQKYGLRFWQSEYCIMSNDSEIGGGGGRDMSMKTALYVARLIHHDIVTAGASAWQWWLAISPDDYKDGLIFVDKDMSGTENVYVPKLLWAFGNYSRFIRPGAVRTDAVSSDEDILASSYRNVDGSEVIVIQNHKDEDAVLDTGSAGYGIYLTSDNENDNLRYLGETMYSNIYVPSRSIVTLVKK